MNEQAIILRKFKNSLTRFTITDHRGGQTSSPVGYYKNDPSALLSLSNEPPQIHIELFLDITMTKTLTPKQEDFLEALMIKAFIFPKATSFFCFKLSQYFHIVNDLWISAALLLTAFPESFEIKFNFVRSQCLRASSSLATFSRKFMV